jgi:hypothetical protein
MEDFEMAVKRLPKEVLAATVSDDKVVVASKLGQVALVGTTENTNINMLHRVTHFSVYRPLDTALPGLLLAKYGSDEGWVIPVDWSSDKPIRLEEEWRAKDKDFDAYFYDGNFYLRLGDWTYTTKRDSLTDKYRYVDGDTFACYLAGLITIREFISAAVDATDRLAATSEFNKLKQQKDEWIKYAYGLEAIFGGWFGWLRRLFVKMPKRPSFR